MELIPAILHILQTKKLLHVTQLRDQQNYFRHLHTWNFRYCKKCFCWSQFPAFVFLIWRLCTDLCSSVYDCGHVCLQCSKIHTAIDFLFVRMIVSHRVSRMVGDIDAHGFLVSSFILCVSDSYRKLSVCPSSQKDVVMGSAQNLSLVTYTLILWKWKLLVPWNFPAIDLSLRHCSPFLSTLRSSASPLTIHGQETQEPLRQKSCRFLFLGRCRRRWSRAMAAADGSRRAHRPLGLLGVPGQGRRQDGGAGRRRLPPHAGAALPWSPASAWAPEERLASQDGRHYLKHEEQVHETLFSPGSRLLYAA